MPDNIFNKLGNLFKGRKPEAEPTPQPAAEPEKKQSLADINTAEIAEELKELSKPELSLREMLDTVSARMINIGREPYVSTGQQLQLYRLGLTTAESPFLDYDEALIAAVDQLEHFCALEDDTARTKSVNNALTWLTNAFKARAAGTPSTEREALELKCHFLRMQLLSQQGQLFSSNKRLLKQKKLLQSYQKNPARDPNGLHQSFTQSMIEQGEQREKVLNKNIEDLRQALAATEGQIGTAPLVSIDPAKILSSVVKDMAAERVAYQVYLRQLSDFLGLLGVLDTEMTEIRVLERATEQRVQTELYKLELNRQMRAKMSVLDKPAMPVTPTVSPEMEAPVENVPAPSVEEVEEPVVTPMEATIFDDF